MSVNFFLSFEKGIKYFFSVFLLAALAGKFFLFMFFIHCRACYIIDGNPFS